MLASLRNVLIRCKSARNPQLLNTERRGVFYFNTYIVKVKTKKLRKEYLKKNSMVTAHNGGCIKKGFLSCQNSGLKSKCFTNRLINDLSKTDFQKKNNFLHRSRQIF